MAIAMIVAITATTIVFQRMAGYSDTQPKLARPYSCGGRAWGSPTFKAAWIR